MSDHILVRGSDGKLMYLQRKSLDRQQSQGAGGGMGPGSEQGGPRTRAAIEDIVDISAGLRAAADVRAETDPARIKDKVEAGRRQIDSNLARFFSLFETRSSPVSNLGRFLSALVFGRSADAGYEPEGSDSRPGTLRRFAALLFGRSGRRRF